MNLCFIGFLSITNLQKYIAWLPSTVETIFHAPFIWINTACEAKTVTHLQTGPGGQGLEVEVQIFAGIFFQHTGFKSNQKI